MDKNLVSFLVKLGMFTLLIAGGLFSDGLTYFILTLYWFTAIYGLLQKEEDMKKDGGLRTSYLYANRAGQIAIVLMMAWFGHWITAFVVTLSMVKAYAVAKSVTDSENA